MAIDGPNMNIDNNRGGDTSFGRTPREQAMAYIEAGVTDAHMIAQETGLSIREIEALGGGDGIGSIQPGLYADDSSPEDRSGDFSSDSHELDRLEGRRRLARHEDRYSGQSLDIRHIRPRHLNRHRA